MAKRTLLAGLILTAANTAWNWGSYRQERKQKTVLNEIEKPRNQWGLVLEKPMGIRILGKGTLSDVTVFDSIYRAVNKISPKLYDRLPSTAIPLKYYLFSDTDLKVEFARRMEIFYGEVTMKSTMAVLNASALEICVTPSGEIEGLNLFITTNRATSGFVERLLHPPGAIPFQDEISNQYRITRFTPGTTVQLDTINVMHFQLLHSQIHALENAKSAQLKIFYEAVQDRYRLVLELYDPSGKKLSAIFLGEF